MGAALVGPPLGDTERLLWLVRHLQPAEFARTFRRGLANAEFMRVISAPPAERRRALTETRPAIKRAGPRGPARTRPPSGQAAGDRDPHCAPAGPDEPVAGRPAGRRPLVHRLAVGTRRDRALRLHMAALLGVLPGLTDLLDSQTTPTARGQPAGTRAS